MRKGPMKFIQYFSLYVTTFFFSMILYAAPQTTVNATNVFTTTSSKINSSSAKYVGQPISLNFQNIPIRSVLEILADFTGMNIVASDKITGNVTLRLTNIPWDEALDIILLSNHLGKKQMGSVIVIAPMTDIVAQEQQLLSAQQKVQALEPLQTQFIRLNYAKATDIQTLIKNTNNNLLSQRGTVSVDKRTNTLIIQDTLNSLKHISLLVKKLDIPMQQVMIEARVVNIDTSFEQDLGIRWGLSSPHQFSSTIKDANDIRNDLGETDISPPTTNHYKPHLNVDLPANVAGVQSPTVGLALAELNNGYMLDLELSAIETEGGGELISSPRLLTANQHPALIEAGTEIPYQENTSSGATAVEFKKAVLSLKVTPQITPDGKIIMDIKVNQDKVDDALDVDGVPAIDTREIVTNVLVGNGDTIVLGGIYEHNQSKQVERVPYLGSIPYLGYFFRNTDTVNKRTELLIFITPKIVQQLPNTR